MRGLIKKVLNGALAIGGVKLVNRNWGPRGFEAAFERTRAHGFRPELVLDIGAAQGTWTRAASAIFPDARYVLVDPLPENVTPLNKVVDGMRDARAIIAAAGEARGTIQMYVHGDQSSCLPSTSFSGPTIGVPVRTCDDIVTEVWGSDRGVSRILLKIDVQGHEIEVLRGARKTLEHTELILVEVSTQRLYEGNPLAHEVIAHLGGHGFCIYDIASYVQRPYDGALAQVDLVLLRESSPLMAHIGW